MPALVWLGRRWRVGSDDFCFSSLLLALASAASCIVVLMQCRTSSDASSMEDGSHSGINLYRCPEASHHVARVAFGLGITDGCVALAFLGTLACSVRGSIFEQRKRRLVPFMLYIVSLSLIAALVLAAFLTKYILVDGEASKCRHRSVRHILEGAIALNYGVAGFFFFMFMVAVDFSGRTTYTSNEDYSDTWLKRINCLRWGRTARGREEDAYLEVSKVFALAFRGFDVVPSDIAAGILLLNGYQRTSRLITSSQMRYAPNPAGLREEISSQACPVDQLDENGVELVRLFTQYSRFYMGAYGWMLYQFMHCCTGLPQLCGSDPFMCCRHHSGNHHGTRCFCDVTALRRFTDVDEEDIIVANWKSELFQPVYYAAYDRQSDAVVIAIRGTMSFGDCMTDMAATPAVVELNDHLPSVHPEDLFVHGGILEGARYILRCLDFTGTMHLLLEGKYAHRPVIVLGHSLGAGVALILSTLLWSERPALRGRLRCLAYSPPGGTMSEAVAEYCKTFAAGCFLGYDMIPRLAQHTFDIFRESMFDVMAASSTPKALLFLNLCRTEKVARKFHPSTTEAANNQDGGGLASPSSHTVGSPTSMESWAFREQLRALPSTVDAPLEATKRLIPCTSLIYYRKIVTQYPDECCSSAEDIYLPCLIGAKDVQALVAAPSMFTDHFPDRLYDVLEKSLTRLESGQLDRFYSNSATFVSSAPAHHMSPVPVFPGALKPANAVLGLSHGSIHHSPTSSLTTRGASAVSSSGRATPQREDRNKPGPFDLV